MGMPYFFFFFFFSSRRLHTRWTGDWSSDVCSSDLELLGEGLDHGGDRGSGPGQLGLEAVALAGDRIGGAGGFQPLADLGADQGRVGEQGGDVVPYDGVGVVGADWLAGADPPVFVPVVVRSQAPVVVDLVARGGGRMAAVVAVSAGRAGGQALEQGGDLAVAGGVPLVVGQPPGSTLERLGRDDGRDADLDPFLAGPVDGLDRAGRGAPLEPGDPVQPWLLVNDPGLAEHRLACVGGITQHPPYHAAVP